MKQKVPLPHLSLLAICVALSLVTKRVISPVTNLLTDLIRIPGGGAATAFSLMFLIIGTAGIKWRWATTAAAFVQSIIALAVGMSAYQGIFALLTYTLPGFVADLLRMTCPKRNMTFFVVTCALANSAGAFLTNLLVFQLAGITFLLWLLIAACMGILGGLLGDMLYQRLIGISEYRRIVSCQRN